MARVLNLAECCIEVGYGKSVAQAYAEATFYTMHDMRDLLPLSMVSKPSHVQIQGLPSLSIRFLGHWFPLFRGIQRST
jgi:hypothetical protein